MEAKPKQESVTFQHTLGGTTQNEPPDGRQPTSGWQSDLERGNSSSGIMGKQSTSTTRSMMSMKSSSTSRRLVAAANSLQDTRFSRGLPAYMAMRRFGKLFAEEGDPFENMAMSEHVAEYDDFISHNWAVNRGIKWLTLCLRYNFFSSVRAALTVGILVTLLTAFKVIDLIQFEIPKRGSDGVLIFNSQAVLFVGNGVFIITFFFWQDIKHVFRQFTALKEKMVFVDRSCIHQLDDALKVKGMQSLPTLVQQSHHFVAVYNPLYLRRLWTVYELACFLTVHKGDQMRPVMAYSTTWVWPVLSLAFGTFVLEMVGRFLEVANGETSLAPSLLQLFFIVFIFSYCIRRWEKTLFDAEETVRVWSIRTAPCAAESDRKVLQQSAATFMKTVGRVASHAPLDEALDSFDELVHEELAVSVVSALRSWKFPYLLSLAFSVPLILHACDRCLVLGIAYDMPLLGLAQLPASIAASFIGILGNNIILSPIMSRNVQLQGWKEVLYWLVGTLPFMVIMFLVFLPAIINNALEQTLQPDEGGQALFFFTQVTCYGFLCSILVWTSKTCACLQRQWSNNKAQTKTGGVSVSV